jgi:hypothetical protein
VNISGNAAIDVVVGLAFFYFLLSVVASAVNEGIASALNLRAKELEKGIVKLLGDAGKNAFYEHRRVQALFKPKRFLEFLFTDKKPSYIPSRVFATTTLELAAKPAGAAPAGQTTVDLLLADARQRAGSDAARLQAELEESFDEVMDRVSGWYKRRVQLVLFVISLVLVGLANADSLALGQRLWKNQALRASVVAQASNTAAGGSNASCVKGGENASPQDRAAKCVDEVKQLGIPVGWSTSTSPHGWASALGKVLGLLVTAFALLLGAPFWFDLLGKVSQLRGAGPPPTDKKSARAGRP